MRRYVPKGDVQKKPYYSDRFYVSPQVAKYDVDSDEVFAADLKAIKEKFEVTEAYIQVEQLVVFIKPEDNFNVIKMLKDELEYTQLSELSAIDWLAKKGQFEIFYQLLSMNKRKRIRIKFFIEEKQSINSVNELFRAADWSEREMYDMYGVKISNHPFMKRILMPDDWQGFPLRKTYPLHGDEAAQWYEVDKIFGREARDVIGPEIRDSAAVDRYDTERFSRLGFEVKYGEDYKETPTKVSYQEDEGVFLIDEFNPNEQVTISDRKR
ncbi:MAG: NADH-quinone oxidoreductase subunit C [Campylobacterota bacterium]|nr:NADH-quinone oxidoreductase subunit C [Campylobacterota bacterium]